MYVFCRVVDRHSTSELGASWAAQSTQGVTLLKVFCCLRSIALPFGLQWPNIRLHHMQLSVLLSFIAQTLLGIPPRRRTGRGKKVGVEAQLLQKFQLLHSGGFTFLLCHGIYFLKVSLYQAVASTRCTAFPTLFKRTITPLSELVSHEQWSRLAHDGEPWSNQGSDLCGHRSPRVPLTGTMASNERLYEVWMLYCTKVRFLLFHTHFPCGNVIRVK